jgi:hypothetical protein
MLVQDPPESSVVKADLPIFPRLPLLGRIAADGSDSAMPQACMYKYFYILYLWWFPV